jgi:hypothetical protein
MKMKSLRIALLVVLRHFSAQQEALYRRIAIPIRRSDAAKYRNRFVPDGARIMVGVLGCRFGMGPANGALIVTKTLSFIVKMAPKRFMMNVGLSAGVV